MEGRKWEDLEVDCLVNVLKKVGIESLLLYVPFVCKSWYKASLNPLCWESLIFPPVIENDEPWYDDDDEQEEYFMSKFMDVYKVLKGDICVTRFINSIVNRSRGNAKVILLPNCCTDQGLKYVADECPELTTLLLHPYVLMGNDIQICINKWKHLEFLRLGRTTQFAGILEQISLHCKNFWGLFSINADIGEEEASSIVTFVPNIKFLSLESARLKRENLVTILQGCKKLRFLDVSKCIGFECDDEILKLASHIDKFMCEGATTHDIFREIFEELINVDLSDLLQLCDDIHEVPEDD